MVGMNRPSLALVALFGINASIFAQESQFTVAKLEPPVYPPMALAARVWGDVILNVMLASDGSSSAAVTIESGPAMLRQAAINSATGSQFQANPENQSGYRLVYRFALDQTAKCEHDDSYPRVKQEANLITITEQNVPICDPAAVIETIRFRSAKCLYMWKCGSKTP
jgi:hypothetical protein